jgi:hypothetical protein
MHTLSAKPVRFNLSREFIDENGAVRRRGWKALHAARPRRELSL